MNNKVVTLLISTLIGGGAERVCVTLANNFVKQGYLVKLIVLNLKNSVYKKDLDRQIEIVNLNVNHARYAFIKLASYIIKKKPEKILVFNHQLAVLLVLIKTSTFSKLKIISRNINAISLDRKYVSSIWHKYFAYSLIKIFYNKVDIFIAQCNVMKKDLVNNLSIDPNKISVIYNPLNQIIEEYKGNTSVKRNEILFVGQLRPQKAIHYLLKAFSTVLKQNEELILRIIGEGTEKEKLVKLSKNLNILKSIIWEPFQKDIIPFYLNAKTVALSSLYEGFPNVLIESIALGTPVVSFDCPSGPNEIIEQGINGFLVEYKNVNELADRIVDALNCDWDTTKLKKTALKFRSDHITKKYLQVIRSA